MHLLGTEGGLLCSISICSQRAAAAASAMEQRTDLLRAPRHAGQLRGGRGRSLQDWKTDKSRSGTKGWKLSWLMLWDEQSYLRITLFIMMTLAAVSYLKTVSSVSSPCGDLQYENWGINSSFLEQKYRSFCYRISNKRILCVDKASAICIESRADLEDPFLCGQKKLWQKWGFVLIACFRTTDAIFMLSMAWPPLLVSCAPNTSKYTLAEVWTKSSLH